MTEKYYQLGTRTAEQWLEIHNELTQATSGLGTIPDRCVQCHDDKPHSPTRGVFLLTDEEAEALKVDPRIAWINIDYTSYPEIYKPDPEELQATNAELLTRWQGNVKVYREFETSNTLPISPNSTDINRTGFQLLRPMQKLDPWVATAGSGTVGSFVSVPAGWTQEFDVAAYIFLGNEPGNLSFSVQVQGPTDLRVLLDPAVDSSSGNIDVTTQIEILDSESTQVEIYNNSITGVTGGNPIISEAVSGGLTGNEIYTINYTMNYTINSGIESDFLWAIGINASLGSGTVADNTVINSNIQQYGDGTDVDVIVADDGGGWIGHPEFQNNCTGAKPDGYTGGNVLPGNGTCDVLDLVLDAPYYLDPDYFNADPGNRLITRWDGTRVPVESFARGWWSNSANRSSVFNTAYPNVGTVTVTSLYTRAFCNGSNTAQSSVGTHCTPCMALTYGRTQGWAYNANKWVLNHYGTNGSDIENGFDLQKIFHLTKPVNSKYGTKDPTVSSNSWGYRSSKGTTNGFYHFRNDAPVQYGGTSSEPAFISHMGQTGDTGRWKSEFKPNSLVTALDELCDSGVIFVVAAGNSNQKQVKWDHPDYDNYISATNTQTLEETSYFDIGVEVYGTTNRRGFPQMGGKVVLNAETGEIEHKAINIGALDDDFATGNLERKVNYSDRGNDIDFYMPADGTLAANRGYTPEGRYPDTYPGFTANSGSGAGVPEDCAFGGTSAACPVAAGFIATLVGLNRNWTYRDVRNYIQGLEVQPNDRFYYGVESTTATDANWFDYNSLEGGDARVGYQNPAAIQQTTFPKRTARISSGVNIKGVQINYVQKFDRGR
jgi:hypothetical protein